jgi:murein DD-endopeptidase MepM/ murein hydrolase activator NlpD
LDPLLPGEEEEEREPCWTLLVVPDHGGGQVKQLQVRQVTLKRWGFGIATLLGTMTCLAIGSVVMLPRSLQYGEIRAENLELKARLREVESVLDEVDRTLRRIRLYDAQLREVTESDLLPGFGPISDDEAEFLELDEDEPDLPWPGEDGAPMEEIGQEEDASQPLGDWASNVQQRAELLQRLLEDVEPRLGSLAEEMEDLFSLQSAFPQLWPVEGQLTSGFGTRRSPISRLRKFHKGIDISAPRGARVFATSPGVVVLSQYASGYGRLVALDHGYGIVTRYAHNTSLLVRVGDWVEVGEVIATVGSTGQSTGPHLHFELLIDGQPVDPLDYLPR